MSSPIESQNGSLSKRNNCKVVVHQFSMADVEDPYVIAGFQISEWQNTEVGKFCMDKSLIEMTYTVAPDFCCYGFTVKLHATLAEEDYTFYKLKYT